MKNFWVIGGQYTDTTFTNLCAGHKEERYGPFASYDEAKAQWQALAWSCVDECQARYTIIEE